MMMRLFHLCSWASSNVIKVLKRKSSLVLLSAFVFIILLRWRFVCNNTGALLHINDVCTSYSNGAGTGNLCGELCHPKTAPLVICHSHDQKSTVFSLPWYNNTKLIFKSAKTTEHNEVLNFGNNNFNSEDFSKLIKTSIKVRFNMIISDIDAKKLIYLHISSKWPHKLSELTNVKVLIHNNEYLALILYERFDIFPKLIGTCGTLYAVQHLTTISGFWHLMTLYDSHEEWMKRIKIAIKILDFTVRLEKGLPEPLSICNVKMNHFGLSEDLKRIMYLNLDSVHPTSVAGRITGDGSKCKKHSDCDFLNCRSFCNLITLKCQHGVVNNNLQIVCERIFLGWVMAGKVVLPGLLMGPHTPHVLIELLEECANPDREVGTPRAMATKDVRKRLYDLLVHITY